jgi:7-cyano-7-deazaguanine synthase in queuosine biosynthesis
VNNEKKTVLICWSGGLDSTSLACHYLAAGYRVHALSLKLLTNQEKCKREEQARLAMFDAYFKNFDFKMIRGLEIYNPAYHSFHPDRGNRILMQEAPGWLLGVLAALHTDHDEVAIGYVADDVVTATYREKFLAIWQSFSGLALNGLPPLKFPLFELHKPELYAKLPEELRSLVTWCNSTDKKAPCGICDPCRKMVEYSLMEPVRWKP